MGAGSLKRLRVRLKATDPDSLADLFGGNLSERGVFLKSNQLLPIGTPVLLELLYRSGELALRGRGKVESVSSAHDARGMHLDLEWAEESAALARWVIDRHAPATSDPYEEVTVLAADAQFDVEQESDDVDHDAEQPTVPEELTEQALVEKAPAEKLPAIPRPTQPPPPVPPPELVGQRPGSKDSWDLVSDLLDLPPPPPAPRPDPDEEREAMEDAFQEVEEREPGEVTPLARIELVRSPVSDPIRTGDIPPLGLDEDSGPIPLPRSMSKIARPSKRIMAIDFGTVNTRCAVSMDDRPPRILDSRRGAESTPSVVMIRDSGKTIIGEPALRKLSFHPREGILDARRLIGLPFASERVQHAARSLSCQLVPGEDGEAAVRVGPYDISFEEIAALVLKEIRECALMALEQRVNRAVLTCPFGFGFRQREALRVAAKLAGIYCERLVSEPVAVAVHAMHENPRGGRVFVYRLGGGTFDATILAVDGDHYQVLASESDLFLGGVDFDASAALVIAEDVARSTGLDAKNDPSAMAIMMEAARKAKQMLSLKERATVFIDAPASAGSSFQIEVEVFREKMERLWAPLVDRTIAISKRVLESAGLTAKDIDHVVLAGGQARAPLVRQRVRELLRRDPLDVDPERAAVLGAASMVTRLDQIRVRDLLGTSLFVAEFDAPLGQLIAQGAALPALAEYRVRATPRKSGTELMLCEGSGPHVADAVGILRVGPFTGTAELKFEVSIEGLLSVSAVESGTRRPIRAELVTDLATSAEDPSKERAKNGRSSVEK